MTALKGVSIDKFLSQPDRPVVLVYGPDVGLVQERSAAIIASFLGPGADTMSRTVLDGDKVAAAPQRLAEEALSVPMFGGRTAIRVTPTAKSLLAAVEPLLRDPPADSLVVIEGGDLKPSAPLRRHLEKAAVAAVIPCYVDDDKAIDRLIAEELAAHGLMVSSDARQALHRLLGGDRLASRGELRKLASYALGQAEVSLQDVQSVIGDASALAIDSLVDGACLGDAAAAESEFARSLATGIAPGPIVGALSRHFLQLAEARARVEAGSTAEAALKAVRPPIFFKREQAVRRQLGFWSQEAIGRMLDMLLAAEGDIRRNADLAEPIAGRAMFVVANTARQARSR